MRRDNDKLLPIAVAGVVILIVGGIIGYYIWQANQKNSYGPDIRIDNFAKMFKEVPKDRENAISAALYTAIKENTEDAEAIPKTGAVIRDGESQYTFNKETGIYYGNFLVDIAELQQSYRVQFEWSKTAAADSADSSGYSVVVTCAGAYSAYPESPCHDMFTKEEKEAETLTTEYPIMKKLPLDIDYYDAATGRYISYKVSGAVTFSEDNQRQYTITITDRSGGNRELALRRLRELKCGAENCKLDGYVIKYVDQSLGVGRPPQG